MTSNQTNAEANNKANADNVSVKQPAKKRSVDIATAAAAAFSGAESSDSEYEPYGCTCKQNKCDAEVKDYISSGEETPPILYTAPSGLRNSQDSVTFKIAQPKCQCANCPVKNLCKSTYIDVGQTLSKRFRYANFELFAF